MRDVHMLIRSCLFYYQFCASIPLQTGMAGLAAYGTLCRSARERPPTYHKIPPDEDIAVLHQGVFLYMEDKIPVCPREGRGSHLFQDQVDWGEIYLLQSP